MSPLLSEGRGKIVEGGQKVSEAGTSSDKRDSIWHAKSSTTSCTSPPMPRPGTYDDAVSAIIILCELLNLPKETMEWKGSE